MSQINFDATGVAPLQALDAIPAGWYNVLIDQSEMKPAKTAGNFFLELRLNVIDGQYVGRKLFSRINLRNSNPQAQEIAYRELSAVCHAVGRIQVGDSSELHNLPLKVKVKVKPADANYEAGNEISGYANINTATAPGAVPPATMAPAAPWAPPPAAAQPPQAAWAPPTPPAPPAAPAGWAPPVAAQPWATAPIAQPAVTQPTQAAPAAPAGPAHPAQAATPPWAAPAAPVAQAAPAQAAPPWATPAA